MQTSERPRGSVPERQHVLFPVLKRYFLRTGTSFANHGCGDDLLVLPSILVALPGGDIEPGPGLHVVLGHTSAGSVQDTEVALCQDVPSFGSLAEPLQGLIVVLRLTLAGGMHDTAIVLCLGRLGVYESRVPSRPSPAIHGKGPQFHEGLALRRGNRLSTWGEANDKDQSQRAQRQSVQASVPLQGSPRFPTCIQMQKASPGYFLGKASATAHNPALCQLLEHSSDLLNRVLNYSPLFNTKLQTDGNEFVTAVAPHMHTLEQILKLIKSLG